MKFKHTTSVAAGAAIGTAFTACVIGYMQFMDWLINFYMPMAATMFVAMAPLVLLMIVLALCLDIFVRD